MEKPFTLLTYIDLVQDIDVLLPVLVGVAQRTSWRSRVVVARWLRSESPRIGALLRRWNIPFATRSRRTIIAGESGFLRGISALLTASESSAAAHAAAHRLVFEAQLRGIPTFTLQHGLENVGLTPQGDGYYETFLSKNVLCWAALDGNERLPVETRRKAVIVGRPFLAPTVKELRFDVAVFENLHHDTYSERDRRDFLAGLEAFSSIGGLRVALRTHPAGAWLDPLAKSYARFGWAVSDGASSRSSPENAMDLAASARRVITTASTVALDAAMVGRPVAIAAPSRPCYEPLPVLRTPDDWLTFLSKEARGDGDAFMHRRLLPGDAVQRVLERLAAFSHS